MGAADRSLPISGCFAAISLIDVILVWRLSFPVFLNHGVKNLTPFRNADDMIFRHVSRFRIKPGCPHQNGRHGRMQ